MAEVQVEVRPGWMKSQAGVPYPPEPWFLGGALAGAVYFVPVSQLPRELLEHIPADHQLVTFGGRVPVSVCFVHYGPGSVLSYEELLVAVPVRRGLRFRVSIFQIWVDSPSSVAGGRGLWCIPKELANFERDRDEARLHTVMRSGNVEVATLDAQLGGAMIPGRWTFPLTTAQRLGGREVISSNLIVGRPRRLRASFRFAENGPLAWLNNRRPWFGILIDDAAIAFGQRVNRR
ncbi:MAG TPA: acetoacetate decarboxylase family protein [Polyangiales bacterium]